MKKNEENVLERNLEQKHFEDALEAIKGGKESGSLNNVELVEALVESYKGKTVEAPIEVIATSAIFLNAEELISIIEVLRDTLHFKMAEILKERAKKGEVTADDAMAALMLTASMGKKSKKD